MKISRRLAVTAGSTALVVFMAAGGAVAGSTLGSSVPENAGVPDPAPTAAAVAAAVPEPGTTSYKTNAQGLTYGSELDAATPADVPDLILAIATNGKEGYVLKGDLYPQLPTSPAEAIAWQKEQNATRSVTRIPVYAQDGVTVIGEFEITPPVELESAPN